MEENNKVSVKVYTYGIKYNIYGKIIAMEPHTYTIECLPEQVIIVAKSVALIRELISYDRVELRWQFLGERYMYHYTKIEARTYVTYIENTPHQWDE